jgi:hypothetical protein
MRYLVCSVCCLSSHKLCRRYVLNAMARERRYVHFVKVPTIMQKMVLAELFVLLVMMPNMCPVTFVMRLERPFS